jgi:hypothetical protein
MDQGAPAMDAMPQYAHHHHHMDCHQFFLAPPSCRACGGFVLHCVRSMHDDEALIETDNMMGRGARLGQMAIGIRMPRGGCIAAPHWQTDNPRVA